MGDPKICHLAYYICHRAERKEKLLKGTTQRMRREEEVLLGEFYKKMVE